MEKIIVTKSKHDLNLLGTVIYMDSRKFTIGGMAQTKIEGEYIYQWWILIEEETT